MSPVVLTGETRRKGHMARILVAFALLAFAARALLPAGYMLAPNGDARVLAITLCSGAEVLMDLSTGELVDEHLPAPSDSSSDHDQPCAFNAIATFTTPAGSPSLAPTLHAIAVSPLQQTMRPGRGLAAPPPWPTGPPPLA